MKCYPYSSILLFLFTISTVTYSQNPCPGIPTVTHFGKTYNTVQIGNQCWLKENLDVGAMILGNQEQTNNSVIEKYCYNNDPNNCITYGGLYQWAETVQYKNGATNTTSPNPAFIGNVQGICPDSWHIPTVSEYLTLASYVKNNSNTLKEIGQGYGDGVGTNTSGFSTLLAGYMMRNNSFYGQGGFTHYWTTNERKSFSVYYLNIYSYGKDIEFGWNTDFFGNDVSDKTEGNSIRCVNDKYFTSISDDPGKNKLPKEYLLYQNYPNPFNPNTLIKFSIPKDSHVTLKIYDELGKEIATLVDGEKNVGNYEVNFDGTNLSSGIYYVKIQAGDFMQIKKMILMK